MNSSVRNHNFLRNYLICFGILSLSIFTFSSGYSQISFAPYKAYSTGSEPLVVCIDDVNNDNLNDVVLGTGFYYDTINDFKLFVYLQNNSGNLLPPVKYSYSTTFPGLSSIAITDINHDGLNDVIIGYDTIIGIFYQNNSGTLNSEQSYYGGDDYSIDGISAGDLNFDGLNDIAVSHWGSNVISVLYQKSSGGFAVQNYPAPAGGYDQIEVADVNNDQLDDVVLMLGQGQGGIYIFTQNNAGTLNNYVPYFNDQGWYSGGIAVGDLNNDNANDIVKTVYANSPASKIALFIQDDVSNLLLSPLLFSAYDCPEPVRIADLNCDGRNEIIVAHGGWQAISVYEQDINNTYNSYIRFFIPYASHYQPQGLCVGDINHDQKKDVVIADYGSGLIVLLNKSIGDCCKLPAKPSYPDGDSIICSDDKIAVYKTKTSLTDHITWNLFPVQSGTIISSNNDSCKILWNNSWRGAGGIYVTATNSCGSINSDTLIINGNRLPLINLGNDTTLCENDTLLLSAGTGFTSFQWQDNSTDSIYLVTMGGTYSVLAGNVCGTSYDTISVTEVPLPEIDLKDTTLCSGNVIQLDITKPEFSKYLWQDNATGPVYVISSPGTYTVEITDSNNCSNIQSISVEELEAPYLQWPLDTTVCSQNTYTLQAENFGSNYLWQDGTTQPQHLVTESGVYSVSVTNQCGSAQATITVNMEECAIYLDVPSAFSPNGDGLNDILYPIGLFVEQVHFLIFSRWGQKVYESNSLTEGWDGTCRGKILDPGVFVYSVTAISAFDGHIIQKQGNISLIR